MCASELVGGMLPNTDREQVADKAMKDWLNMIEHDYDPLYTTIVVASNDTVFAVDLRRLFNRG